MPERRPLRGGDREGGSRHDPLAPLPRSQFQKDAHRSPCSQERNQRWQSDAGHRRGGDSPRARADGLSQQRHFHSACPHLSLRGVVEPLLHRIKGFRNGGRVLCRTLTFSR